MTTIKIPTPTSIAQAQPKLAFRANRLTMRVDVGCPQCGKYLAVLANIDHGDKTLEVLGHEDPLCQAKDQYAESDFLDRVDDAVRAAFEDPTKFRRPSEGPPLSEEPPEESP